MLSTSSTGLMFAAFAPPARVCVLACAGEAAHGPARQTAATLVLMILLLQLVFIVLVPSVWLDLHRPAGGGRGDEKGQKGTAARWRLGGREVDGHRRGARRMLESSGWKAPGRLLWQDCRVQRCRPGRVGTLWTRCTGCITRRAGRAFGRWPARPAARAPRCRACSRPRGCRRGGCWSCSSRRWVVTPPASTTSG